MKSRFWEKKEGEYAKTLAKFQVIAIFLMQDMRRNFLPKFIEICMGRHAGAHPDGHQHGGRKPIETSVTEFCYKRVNLSLEKLKNIKIILFCNTRTVQVVKFHEISPEISRFLTNSAVMQNAA